MVHVLVCTDQDGHCGQDVCVIAVSKDRHRLEDLIEEKKKDDSYKYCIFRIYEGIESIDSGVAGESATTERDAD